MAFRLKKKPTTMPITHHLGTFALPSQHAISVHVETGGAEPRWIYSQDPITLKPEDLAHWEAEIAPTLEGLLKQKRGFNRHGKRQLQKLVGFS